MKLVVSDEDMTEGWRLHGATRIAKMRSKRAWRLTATRCRCGGRFTPLPDVDPPSVECIWCGLRYERDLA